MPITFELKMPASCTCAYRDPSLHGLQDGLAKIGDVGMAKVMSEGTMTQDAVVGTFAWASPELLLGERCVSLSWHHCHSLRISDRLLVLLPHL